MKINPLPLKTVIGFDKNCALNQYCQENQINWEEINREQNRGMKNRNGFAKKKLSSLHLQPFCFYIFLVSFENLNINCPMHE